MRIVGRVVVVVVLAVLSSCGGREGSEAIGKTDASAPPVAKAKSAPATKVDACDMLTASLIGSQFQVAEAELQSGSRRNNFCSWRWKKPNSEEIMEQNRKNATERMMANIEATRQGKAVNYDLGMKKTENLISLSLAPAMADHEQAANAFKATEDRLQKGVSVQIDAKTKQKVRQQVDEATKGQVKADPELPDSVRFQADTTAVAGVGDDAFWAPSMHQLTVLSGNVMFHLSVEVSEEDSENLGQARELAAKIIEKL